jgi:hypothetical protein
VGCRYTRNESENGWERNKNMNGEISFNITEILHYLAIIEPL